MQLSKVANYALRLSFAQNNVTSVRGSSDRVIGPSAFLMAAFGITLSTFSLKQMLASQGRRC
ncbi:uncharacterized protein [Rhodnius prolixus]